MSIFNSKITDRFFDENVKTSSKIGYAIILILVALIVNDVTSFTYFRNIDKKVENLKKIESLNLDVCDSVTISYVKQLKLDVINRKSIFEKSYYFLFEDKPLNAINPSTNAIDNAKELNKSGLINYGFLFHLTAGGLFYFVTILIIPLFLIQEKKQSIGYRIAIGALVSFVCLSLAVFLSYLCSLIPDLINDEMWLNYILNTIIQLVFIFTLSRFGNKN